MIRKSMIIVFHDRLGICVKKTIDFDQFKGCFQGKNCGKYEII